MSKKLLEESTIRSFMKLANLQPLTDKFLKESSHEDDKKDDKKDKKEDEDEEEEEGSKTLEEETLEEAPPADLERRPETGMQEEKVDEGKESEGRPASPKQKVAGVAKPGKMDAAKNAAGDAKLKPAQKTSHHSDKDDSIQHTEKSNAPKKNNAQFDVVAESLEEYGDKPSMKEEEMDSPEGGDMGGGAESGPHKDKMKGLIRSMLENLKEMGAEYGMTMEISDEAGGGEPEAPAGAEDMGPPAGEEDEGMMQEKLDEMVEKLTKRVAARLVKETKKKR